MPDKDLKEQMIDDALIIIQSVSFVERELNSCFALLEEAVNNHYFEDVKILERRIRGLIAKVGDENCNMDEFMLKYQSLIQDEKKTILSSIKQEEQIHLRSVPTHEGRPNVRNGIQKRPQKAESQA